MHVLLKHKNRFDNGIVKIILLLDFQALLFAIHKHIFYQLAKVIRRAQRKIRLNKFFEM